MSSGQNGRTAIGGFAGLDSRRQQQLCPHSDTLRRPCRSHALTAVIALLLTSGMNSACGPLRRWSLLRRPPAHTCIKDASRCERRGLVVLQAAARPRGGRWTSLNNAREETAASCKGAGQGACPGEEAAEPSALTSDIGTLRPRVQSRLPDSAMSRDIVHRCLGDIIHGDPVASRHQPGFPRWPVMGVRRKRRHRGTQPLERARPLRLGWRNRHLRPEFSRPQPFRLGVAHAGPDFTKRPFRGMLESDRVISKHRWNDLG